ncbi:MAG: YchJ family protein [Desulfobacteraceae bacterium]|nr:YchJ family protein [Desulfobacteraceae bacterium]
MKQNICYCGHHKKYEKCCYPFLSCKLKPETPEQLMRSRYSAFCIKDIEYLIATQHPSMRQHNERDVLTQIVQNTQWLGLKVLKTRDGKISHGFGFVEFIAFYKNIEIEQLHENSKFVYEDQQWYYLDGVILEPVKFSRNEQCWCGSNKKFKRCHGGNM